MSVRWAIRCECRSAHLAAGYLRRVTDLALARARLRGGSQEAE